MLLSTMSCLIDQVSQLTEKQGIVTILGSDMEKSPAACASLRRTLSADMSCNKWLAQNGLPPLNQSPSSKQLCLLGNTVAAPDSSEGEEDAERGQDEIWASIQRDKTNQRSKMIMPQGQSDIWSSMISHKNCELVTSKSVPVPVPAAPYVHPLVKQKQSSLSENSLQICTESLGSETGSDGFASCPRSETGEAEDQEKEVENEHQQQSYDAAVEEEDFRLAKYNHAATAKKATKSPFPPPLPSLSRTDGASLLMRTVRDNGRLVVDAVSVPSQKNFCAERQHGRLLLTFNVEERGVVDGLSELEIKDDIGDMKEEFADSYQFDQGKKEHAEDEDEEEERELEDEEADRTKGIEIVIEGGPRNKSFVGITNVHRLMLKPCVLNRNLSWSQKFNEVVKFEEAEEEKMKVDVNVVMKAGAQSLPPRPRRRTTPLIQSSTPLGSTTAGAACSLNAYEYYWKPRPTSKSETQIFNQFIKHQESSAQYSRCNNKKLVGTKNVEKQNERQQVIVLRGKNGEYLLPMSKACKESRTSVLYWQPYCIASS